MAVEVEKEREGSARRAIRSGVAGWRCMRQQQYRTLAAGANKWNGASAAASTWPLIESMGYCAILSAEADCCEAAIASHCS
jgi:hypothetical protein